MLTTSVGVATGADMFFFQAEDGIRDGTVTGVQTCALPIWKGTGKLGAPINVPAPVDIQTLVLAGDFTGDGCDDAVLRSRATGRITVLVGDCAGDRKSTRLNSSHSSISYAVFCLKKKIRPAYYEPPSSVSLLRRASEMWRASQRDVGVEVLCITGCIVARADASCALRGAGVDGTL